MIELKRNVVMFTILTVGAVYFLYEDLRNIFCPILQAPKEENHESDESTEGYISRKLLAFDSNVKADLLEFRTESNPFIKEKLYSDEKIKEISKSFVSYNILGRNRMKKLRRRKREARHHDLGWKLSLNITNNKNSPQEVSKLGSEDKVHPKSGKEKFLNMAVQLEGASSDNSFEELRQVWDSLGILLKRLYGENTRAIAPKISTESSDVVTELPTEKPDKERTPKFLFGLLNFGNSENPPLESIGTTLENRVSSENVTSPNTNVAPTKRPTSTKHPVRGSSENSPLEGIGTTIENGVSSESVTLQTSVDPKEGPTPKFFLGLLNLGNSENPPIDPIETTLGNRVSSESVTSQKINVVSIEGQTSTKRTKSTNSTEAPMEAFGLVEPTFVKPSIVPVTETFTRFESTSSKVNTHFEEKLEKKLPSPIEITTIKAEPSFTSEQLKEFCISLLSRIHLSPKSVDNFSEEDGSGELDIMSVDGKETVTEFQSLITDLPKEVTTKSANQRFGIWASIWNRFAGRRLVQQPTDVSMQSSITQKHEITLEKVEDSTNKASSFRSDSSTVKSISDSTASDDFFSDEDGSALTVPDCEFFFRQIQNDAVFSKPNLLDIINNPILLSLDPSQFNFSEIHDDKQMRSMRSDSTESNLKSDLLFTEEMNVITSPSNVKSTPKELSDEFAVNELSSEQSNKNSFQNTVSNADLLSTSNPFDAQESFQKGEFDKSQINNLMTENGKKLRKPETSTDFLLGKLTTIEIQPFTDLIDDGLLVNSKTDLSSEILSSEVSADNNDRIFGLFNLGSGERSLEDSDNLSIQNVSEFSENRSFHPTLINFENGDSELNEGFLVNEQEKISTDSVTGLNIFDSILGLRKQENIMNNSESDTSKMNKENQPTESENTITSDEKPRIELPFDSKEKPTESHNVLDLTNIPATQSISNEMPIQNIFDEKKRTEFKIDPEEKFTESLNVVLDSTNTPLTKSSLEDQTPIQNVFDEGNSDEESRLFPGLLNVFGSGDGRDLTEIPADPELTSEVPENKNGNFSVEDYDDYGSDINDTSMLIGEKLSTTINTLSHKIVSDASVHDDAIYLNNKADSLSESNQEPSEFSTSHLPKSLISSPVPETTSYKNDDTSENIGYEAYDDSKNISYEMIDHEFYSSEKYYEATTSQPLEHVHIEGECDESHFDIQTEAFSENPTRVVTDPKDPRFMDTLFLTGSGAGNLFGNDNGEINLVQELDTTSFPIPLQPVTPRQSRRGGRMDDASFDSWPAEHKDHLFTRQSDFTQQQNVADNPQLNFQDTNIDEKSLQIPDDEKVIVTDSISLLTTFGSIQTVGDGFNIKKINEDATLISQDVSSVAVTALNIPTSSFAIPKKKAKEQPPRYCNNAGECNVASNEGCITKMGRGVCDCRRSFVRHPETDICEAPFMMRTSLKLPGEVFHKDLRDKHSELYRNKSRDAIDTMWLVVYQDPTLEYNMADITVTGFEEGSLVIHWQLIFAVKNVTVSEIVQEVDNKLEENFKNEVVLMTAPLNVENAKMLSFSDINPCEKKDLNYCSKDADCIRDEFRGFRCHCKNGFLDNSKNTIYPGEICIEACHLDYCSENGYCELKSNGEKQCLCNGWYFGENCNISGILVISCFGGANCVIIILILAIVFICKRRRQRGTRFYANNQVAFQPGRETGPFGPVSPRLAASIALDELGPTKTSKYMAISTPLYMKPDIQITSPSIMGSSISYDYDSTFDRTPSAEINMEPPKYDAVPEVPKYEAVPEVPKYEAVPEVPKYEAVPEVPKYNSVPDV